tara:strand:+ start:5316 stop:5750 length:435 start_codon:yes stop_codon:yes gene_type:complete
MNVRSTKPYLIRAIYEWCCDSEFTPFISVKVDSNTQVPMEYVVNAEIVLNISQKSVDNFVIDNEIVQFQARFNGVSRKIQIPINAVKGIFAKEINQGMMFAAEDETESENNATGVSSKEESNSIAAPQKQLSMGDGRPELRVIK